MVDKAVKKKIQAYTSQTNEDFQENENLTSFARSSNLPQNHDSISSIKTQLKEGSYYQKLNLSGRRYREVAEMIPDIAFECDLSGNILFSTMWHFVRQGLAIGTKPKS